MYYYHHFGLRGYLYRLIQYTNMPQKCQRSVLLGSQDGLSTQTHKTWTCNQAMPPVTSEAVSARITDAPFGRKDLSLSSTARRSMNLDPVNTHSLPPSQPITIGGYRPHEDDQTPTLELVSDSQFQSATSDGRIIWEQLVRKGVTSECPAPKFLLGCAFNCAAGLKEKRNEWGLHTKTRDSSQDNQVTA